MASDVSPNLADLQTASSVKQPEAAGGAAKYRDHRLSDSDSDDECCCRAWKDTDPAWAEDVSYAAVPSTDAGNVRRNDEIVTEPAMGSPKGCHVCNHHHEREKGCCPKPEKKEKRCKPCNHHESSSESDSDEKCCPKKKEKKCVCFKPCWKEVAQDSVSEPTAVDVAGLEAGLKSAYKPHHEFTDSNSEDEEKDECCCRAWKQEDGEWTEELTLPAQSFPKELSEVNDLGLPAKGCKRCNHHGSGSDSDSDRECCPQFEKKDEKKCKPCHRGSGSDSDSDKECCPRPKKRQCNCFKPCWREMGNVDNESVMANNEY